MSGLFGSSASESNAALQQIAGLATNAAQTAMPGGPGQVNANQKKTLAALKGSANSAWDQYFRGLGLDAASQGYHGSVNALLGTAQATWSQQDALAGLSALNVSSQAYNQYLKNQQTENDQTMKLLESAAVIVAMCVL